MVERFKSEAKMFEIMKCPRNGLSLSVNFDAQKELYWMADYRYLTRPDQLPLGYSLNLVQFALLMNGKSPDEIRSKVNKGTVPTLARHKQLLDKYATEAVRPNFMSEFHKKSLVQLKINDLAKAYAYARTNL